MSAPTMEYEEAFKFGIEWKEDVKNRTWSSMSWCECAKSWLELKCTKDKYKITNCIASDEGYKISLNGEEFLKAPELHIAKKYCVNHYGKNLRKEVFND